MHKNEKIFIVGQGNGAEQALMRHLQHQGFTDIVLSDEIALDTSIQASVNRFFSQYKPDYVFLFSVRSGGIKANQKTPGDFFYVNNASQNHVVYAARKFETKKLIYFASSCIYPKDSPQPMSPEHLMTGPLEPTSASYAMAKLAGIALCQSYRRQYGFNAIIAIPATVYGPGCDVHPGTAHVLGALIAQISLAKTKNLKEVVLWGSGNPRREFLFSEDFAHAALFLAQHYDQASPVNIGYGSDVTICELACLIQNACGFTGRMIFDSAHPDGAMQKLLDSRVITALGFRPKVDLAQGIQRTIHWYQNERMQA